MKFIIEKCLYIKDGKWIVWEKHQNYSIDRYHAKTKRECKKWLSTP